MNKEPTLSDLRNDPKLQWALLLRCAWRAANEQQNTHSAHVYFELDDADEKHSAAVFKELLGDSPSLYRGWTPDQVFALATQTYLDLEPSGLLRIIAESDAYKEVEKKVKNEVLYYLRDARKENDICQTIISDIKNVVEKGKTLGHLINRIKKDPGQWSIALSELDGEVSPLTEAEIQAAFTLLKSVPVQYPEAPRPELSANSRKSQRKPLRPTPEKGENVIHPYSPKSCIQIVERLLETFDAVKRSDILKILEKLLPLWQKPALLSDDQWAIHLNSELNTDKREDRMISEHEKFVVDLASKPYFDAVTEEFLQFLKPADLKLLPDVREMGVSKTVAGDYQIKAVEIARRHDVEEDTMRKRIKGLNGRVMSFFEGSDLDRADRATVLGLACDVLARRGETSI